MKMYKAQTLKSKKSVVAILSDCTKEVPRENYILYKDNPTFTDFGFKGYITKSKRIPLLSKSVVRIKQGDSLQHHIGDIVKIMKDGQIHILWEHDSTQNALFLTENCNLDCIMCPQPPKPHNKNHVIVAHKVLDLLYKNKVSHICITGGEPTIVKKDFLNILTRCSNEHPDSYINILTNGQTLSDFDFAKKCAIRSSLKTCYCISLHGDTPCSHDKIVKKNGAFKNVHSALFNLSKLNVGIELRFVISKMNYKRLPNLADFLFRTYPFVHHFAIMGLEMTGFASSNYDQVWIDPVDYREELDCFVLEAERRGLNFSIYNHQLCVLSEKSRKYARQSISGWKQKFVEKCEKCAFRSKCGGFFSTSGNFVSRGITPINIQQKEVV